MMPNSPDIMSVEKVEILLEKESNLELNKMQFIINAQDDLVIQKMSSHSLDPIRCLKIENANSFKISKIISKLPHLIYLDISDLGLSALPKELSTLIELKTLVAHHNNLKDVNCVESFSNLAKLHLSHNWFTEIPDCFDNMPQMEIVDLSDNNIRAIDIRKISLLRQIGFSNNKIYKMINPTSCESLDYINLSRNMITNIIPLFESNPVNIRCLDFSSNPLDNETLETLSTHSYQFSKLEELDMKNCGLTTLPKFIREMTSDITPNLKRINIGLNNIKVFNDIKDEEFLKSKLIVDGNDISEYGITRQNSFHIILK